jgi:Fe-S cluster assembly protein SufD
MNAYNTALMSADHSPLNLSQGYNEQSKDITFVIPPRKAESWKYLDLRKLRDFNFSRSLNSALTSVSSADIVNIVASFNNNYSAIFLNGILVSGSLVLKEYSFDHIYNSNKSAKGQQDPFLAIHHNVIDQQALIINLTNQEDLKDLKILHLALPPKVSPTAALPKIAISLDVGVKATIVEEFINLDEQNSSYESNNESYSHLNIPLYEIKLAKDSDLTHYKILCEEGAGGYFSNSFVSLDRRANYQVSSYRFGKGVVRESQFISLEGEFANAELSSVAILTENEVSDNFVEVRHSKPNCTSKQNFRALVSGKSQANFFGTIQVDPDAQKTAAFQANNSIILDEGVVNTRPQLKIWADDVKCTHGATIGDLDSNLIFYLQSRGIPKNEARIILAEGFFSELTDSIVDEDLRESLKGKIFEKLARCLVNEK